MPLTLDVKPGGKLEKANICLSMYMKNNYENQSYSIFLGNG